MRSDFSWGNIFTRNQHVFQLCETESKGTPAENEHEIMHFESELHELFSS